MPKPDNESCENCNYSVQTEEDGLQCRADTPKNDVSIAVVTPSYWCGSYRPTRVELNIVEDHETQKNKYKRTLEAIQRMEMECTGSMTSIKLTYKEIVEIVANVLRENK